MRESSVAKRYARALIKTIKDEQEYLEIKKELETFVGLLKQVAEFKTGMETFLFSRPRKKELLETIYREMKFREKTFYFLLVLVEKNRMRLLDFILQLLETQWLEANGIEKLKVYSAVALNEKLEDKLKKGLEKFFARKIKMEKEIDPSLVAGIKVQRGSIFYDFSIAGNLRKFKDALLTSMGAEKPVWEY
ncbi:MAG: ATP synthase F1 subunit delta [Candidatus Aminicenantes bacterium]|nr:ATP synthase F1 subunit delta [Candidatus Aminicenantes bacterium]